MINEHILKEATDNACVCCTKQDVCCLSQDYTTKKNTINSFIYAEDEKDKYITAKIYCKHFSSIWTGGIR